MWGVGWLYEILWAFGTYLGAVGVWPQLVECEREGRQALVRDVWLMAYLGLLYLNAAMKELRCVVFSSLYSIWRMKANESNYTSYLCSTLASLTNTFWDPLSFYASTLSTFLFTYYAIKIFIFRSTSSPSLSLPSFTSSGSSSSASGNRFGAWRNWTWPWRRSEYVALSGEKEALYDGRGGGGSFRNGIVDEQDRIRASSAAAAAEARRAAVSASDTSLDRCRKTHL